MSGAARRLRVGERAFWEAAPPRATRVAFRVAFFGVLALDSVLALAHDARYGAGGFNVSHAPALGVLLPAPGRSFMIAAHALAALLAGRLALGAAGRGALALLAALFGITYFGSQLNSYQHHYLLFLVLVALAARPGRLGDEGPAWPFRLVLCQLSVVYAWAAIAKLAPAWRSGEVLAMQIREPWLRALVERGGGFATVSATVVALELGLAIAIDVRRLRPFAAPIGIRSTCSSSVDSGDRAVLLLHDGLYLLVLPDGSIAAPARGLARAGAAIGRRIGGLGAALRRRTSSRPPRAAPRSPRRCAPATALLAALPFREVAHGRSPGSARDRARGDRARPRPRRRGSPSVTSSPRWPCCVLCRTRPNAALDHYRFLGGSARRLGDLDGSAAAYRRVTELAPTDARGWLGLARAHDRAGRGAEARVAAERALALDPASGDARAIAERWRGAAP